MKMEKLMKKKMMMKMKKINNKYIIDKERNNN